MLKDDRSPHQKSRFFIGSKVVDLSLDVWPLRKALKPFLQNICLLLDLLYHKCKTLITIAGYGSKLEDIIFTHVKNLMIK